MLDKIILFLHALSTFIIFGVIWYAQIAFYPLLVFIGKKEFTKYKKEYNKRVMPLAFLVLITELLTGILLLWIRPISIPLWQVYTGLLLMAIAWILTWFVEVPKHKELELAFNLKVQSVLVRTNLIRAVIWTARVILVFMMLSSL